MIETDRLLLHPWGEDDHVELERLLSDPAVRGGRSFPIERIAAISRDGLRQWRVNGFGPWTGRWIGRVGLDEPGDWPDAPRIEVGFELHQEWLGRGLATEAALAGLGFGFGEHRLDRIISVTAASHAAARRVMEKAGRTYQGTRFWKNPNVPVVWYAIDRDTWNR